MARDTPFQELPTPPASSYQPTSDADLRGNDYGHGTVTDDEYLRAVAYATSINKRVASRNKFLLKLVGNPLAYKALLHKTLPLADSSDSHYIGP